MNNTVFANAFDDWDDVTEVSTSTVASPPKSYLTFNTPPLALTLAMMDSGKYAPEIIDVLSQVELPGSNLDVQCIPAGQHHARADTIYKYFSSKHTMRRLKGEHISEWMMAVEDLCDNRKRIDKNHLLVLATLPKFYEQNCKLEEIMKNHKSVNSSISSTEIDCEVKFVNAVTVSTRQQDEIQYYFQTPDNFLIQVAVKRKDFGNNAWKFIAKHSRIKIKSEHATVSNIRGYDFNILRPISAYTEIEPV